MSLQQKAVRVQMDTEELNYYRVEDVLEAVQKLKRVLKIRERQIIDLVCERGEEGSWSPSIPIESEIDEVFGK